MDTMNVLYDALKDDFNMRILENDMRSIFRMYETQSENTVRDIYIEMQRGMYSSSVKMYNDMLRIIRLYGYERDLLEMMPYIDDYISLFF